jgi:arylsulfatase A-like enzyme
MAKSKQKQPNILVIWGDDIGITNLSCYSHGLMGYQTPNIDRIAKEGMMFTDAYGEQSCTAGRSSFITGQSVYRTGLSKVGIPGAPVGMSEKIVTIAALLKEQSYATGHFGKNHLGDLNHMPTNHGFDEFFGNLYHLNAQEEPEMDNYPSKKEFPKFFETFGPRGVIHSWATDKDDPTEMPRWGKVGRQKIEDTGPLTTKRMETCDDEFVLASKDFIKRQHEDGKPFFVWLNTTHMHLYTHTKASSRGQAGRWQSPYHDTMIDHDKNVGQMLELLDELGIAEDTFVMYSTDNGPHRNAWLRTSVALIGLGFVVSRFGLFLRTITVGHSLSVTTVDQSSVSSLVGTAMVVLGIVFTGIALKNYLDTHKSIMKGSYLPKHVYIYLISISLIVLGAIIVAYLLYVPLSIK